MPYTVRTKDGIEVSGVPDDVKPDDQRVRAEVDRLRAAGQKSSAFSQPQGGPGALGETLQGAGRGLVEGTAALVRGAAEGAAGAVGVLSDPITALVNQVLPEQFRGPTAVEGMSRLLSMIGVPESTTEAQRLVQAASAGMAGAATQAGAGQAVVAGAERLAPSVMRGIGEAIASQPVQQAAGGAGAGVATEAARSMGLDPALQMAAGIGGGIAGGGLGGMKFGGAPGPAPAADAARVGVDLLSTDVRPPQTFFGKWAQSVSEKIPVLGTGGMRRAQQAQRIEAVRDVMRQYGAEDLAGASDDVMNDLIKTRKADLDKWTGYKDEVMQKLTSSFRADGDSTKPVPVPNALVKIDEEISKLTAMKTKEVQPIIDRLTDWREAIQGQDPATLNNVQKQIGYSFVGSDMTNVRSLGNKALSSIYGKIKDGVPTDGLSKDMADYIKENGGADDLNKWLAANKKLSSMMDELELPALKAALDRGEVTPETIEPILFSHRASDVRALFRNLSPEGQASAKAAIVARMAREAEKTGTLSPDRFASQIKKMGDGLGVVFGDAEAGNLRGLARVIDITKRAPAAAQAPSTGIQTLIPTMYTMLAAFIPGTPTERVVGSAAAMSGAGLLARLYEASAKAPAVRAALERLPSARPGTLEEVAAFKRLTEALQAQGQKKTEGK